LLHGEIRIEVRPSQAPTMRTSQAPSTKNREALDDNMQEGYATSVAATTAEPADELPED
jgi:hypothetical protein